MGGRGKRRIRGGLKSKNERKRKRVVGVGLCWGKESQEGLIGIGLACGIARQ